VSLDELALFTLAARGSRPTLMDDSPWIGRGGASTSGGRGLRLWSRTGGCCGSTSELSESYVLRVAVLSAAPSPDPAPADVN